MDDNGTTRGTLLGPVLDGAPGLGRIRDTDDGKYDKQHTWDRPVGPMQITPAMWRKYSVDGNADKRRSPNNVYDASATVGLFLCSQDTDLRDPRGLVQSLLRYNHSTDFVATVLRWMRVYSRSAVIVPNRAGAIPAPAETGNVDRATDPRDVPAVEDQRRKQRPASSSETTTPRPSQTRPIPTLGPPKNLPSAPTVPTTTMSSPTKSPSKTPTKSTSPSESPSQSPSPNPSPTQTSTTTSQTPSNGPGQTLTPSETPSGTPAPTPASTPSGTPHGAPPTA